ncbi:MULTISPECIES: hypothetical protein [Hyphomicrobiales]|jgi:hypothetical protein|uniref:Uncharacterized protein n=1 Tax=Pleomorphomonas carboxyditropha TaxID=2023338 RepID=A0A2G9X2J4_9HYPH|nr:MULTISPECIES: hypothetical protein [Hyphomicrobiales]AWC24824.1 hypothetical protein CO731_04315 [Aminobacter sp. MSH1]MDG9791638.1 hypothetical protein [Brucella anthropi]MDH0581656.1 hypothetical protein [Brucella anthropi]MDH0818566.1 hypothetical protein [Brucella anthropi]MDH2084920.1 hypothetical protein [Brucella anthropi]
MVAVMFMSVALVALLCVIAYTLAVYALPFMLGLTAAQFAYQTGSGLIGAGLVGLFAAGIAFGVLAVLFETIRIPIVRLIVALIFAAPAAVAGYALVHGVTKEAVPSDIWRQIFCVVGGGFAGMSALARLASGVGQPAR